MKKVILPLALLGASVAADAETAVGFFSFGPGKAVEFIYRNDLKAAQNLLVTVCSKAGDISINFEDSGATVSANQCITVSRTVSAGKFITLTEFNGSKATVPLTGSYSISIP